MNIYQNGDFSKNLHKLTKYQSLAATVNDMSKQSLYSKKIQEYKSKLDKVGTMQTGGALTPEQKSEVGRLTSKISKLVPEGFKTEYERLKASHEAMLNMITQIARNVTGLIAQLNQNKVNEEGLNAEIRRLAKDNIKLSDAFNESERLKGELTRKYNSLSSTTVGTDEYQQAMAEITRLRGQLQIANSTVQAQIPQDAYRVLWEELQRQNTQLITDLLTLQEQLNRKGSTGSANCDGEIKEILNDIDNALKPREGIVTPNQATDASLLSTLTSTAQQVLDKLTQSTA